MSENCSRRSSFARPLTRPPSRASNYSYSGPGSPAASASVRNSSASASASAPTKQSSDRPGRSIRSPTLTRKKQPRPQPPKPKTQPRYQIDKVELAKRLEVVANESFVQERFEEGLSQLNGVWKEEEASKEEMMKSRGMIKPNTIKQVSKPGPPAAPAPAVISKAPAAPALLSKVEVICDSYSHSQNGSDISSEQSFHTARSDCTSASFHTAPRCSDIEEAKAEAEAEKAFRDSRAICEHWQAELEREHGERNDSVIRDIANIGR